MSGTPLFVITDVGLAAASTATPTGPYIEITSFQVGSAYGYTPQATDTAINGNLLYQGTASSYSNVGNNTIDIQLEIPPDAGPFNFGEIAVFLNGGVMFAKAVFDTPQTKYSALGSNVVSSYTIHCLLKLQQSTAVFQVTTTNGPPAVWEVDYWSDVYPPGVSANPTIPLTLVRELDPLGNSSLLQNTSPTKWTLGTNYSLYNVMTVEASSTTWVDLATATLPGTDPTQPTFTTGDMTGVNRLYVVETADGYYRSVTNVVQSGANFRFYLNPQPLTAAPTVGSTMNVYRLVMDKSIHYSQIIDPPNIPLATVGSPGLAYGGTGLYMPSAGIIESFGLLHGPSTNTGRVLTSSDNLNNTALPSGVYVTQSASYGFPANLPVSFDGQVWITNTAAFTGVNIQQIYYPYGDGGGTAGTGAGGYPIYWRTYDNTNGWTSWFPFYIYGKQKPGTFGGSLTQVFNTTVPTNSVGTLGSGTFAYNGVLIAQANIAGAPDGTGSGGISGYINGNLVATDIAQGLYYAGGLSITISGYSGSSWSVTGESQYGGSTAHGLMVYFNNSVP